jgi:hypothetical protein
MIAFSYEANDSKNATQPAGYRSSQVSAALPLEDFSACGYVYAIKKRELRGRDVKHEAIHEEVLLGKHMPFVRRLLVARYGSSVGAAD